MVLWDFWDESVGWVNAVGMFHVPKTERPVFNNIKLLS